jgi:hypothetical protein
MARAWIREGHRGFLCENMSITQTVRIRKSPLCVKLLDAYPDVFYWPKKEDLKGSCALIDAVLNENADQIMSMKAQYPEIDLGLDDYLKKISGPRSTKIIKVLKIIEYQHGIIMDVSIVKMNESVKIIATLKRGSRILSSKTLAQKKA